MCVRVTMLMQQVTHDAMHQRGDRQFGIGSQISLERDNAIVFAFVFVFVRQTAETFAGSPASATAATFLRRLNRNLNLQSGNTV